MWHDAVIKGKHFPRYWRFVWGIHRSPVNSPHKGQWRRALMSSLICALINNWVNNREAGDLRRNGAHYDVTVMKQSKIILTEETYCAFLEYCSLSRFISEFRRKSAKNWGSVRYALLSVKVSPYSCWIYTYYTNRSILSWWRNISCIFNCQCTVYSNDCLGILQQTQTAMHIHLHNLPFHVAKPLKPGDSPQINTANGDRYNIGYR